MKLWQCDWVPSSVADWLCRELDERGIPGTTYTHTLLSLLHPYFCPHPVPKDPSQLPKSFINFECVRSILSSGQPQQELEILFEELEDHVHPDADFPELKISETSKEGTRRSKKRQKRKLHQLSLSPERLWKVAALQCLWTASDEPHNLDIIIEELFLRLNKNNKSDLEKVVSLDFIVEEEDNENNKQETVLNFTERCYCSNFPPLSAKKKDKGTTDIVESALNWKSLIKEKLRPGKENQLSPTKQCQEFSIFRDNFNEAKDVFESLKTSLGRIHEDSNLEMEFQPNSIENGELENKAYCFLPIFKEEKCLSNAEMLLQELDISDKEEGHLFPAVDSDTKDINGPVKKERLEEWECAGNLLAEPVNRAVSVDLLGNRLFERSIGSADATRSNSNTDLNTLQLQPEDELRIETDMPIPASSVWGYSDSWKKPHIESVWNSSTYVPQPFNDSNLINIDHLNSDLPAAIHNNQNFLENSNKFENIQIKNRLCENWSSNQNWNSFSLINPIDPVFCSSDNTYNDEATQDCKSTIPEVGTENVKNIWSDFNDNITAVSTLDAIQNERKSPSLIDFKRNVEEEDKYDEKLCRSFKQLGLEHIWEDSLIGENITEELLLKNFSSESSSVFDNNSVAQKEQTLTAEDIFKMKYAQHKEVEDRFLLTKLPCGPTGPYVDLRHTETSGFSAVIPHDKSSQTVLENSCRKEGSLSLTPKEIHESTAEQKITAQEEENLLTSPRTHFRPIRQDSHGSIDETKSEDGQTIVNVTNIQDTDLVFQRSGSGTLYLESDLLKGSPKKYMAYREPAKVQGAVNTSDIQECSVISQPEESPSTVFVPKFKLINNEKFCQTEGPEGSTNLGESVGKELESRILQNELRKYDYLYKSTDENWEGPYPNNIKLIWDEHPVKRSKEAWEIELDESTLHYPKWSTHDLSQTDWSNKRVQLPMQNLINKTSYFDDPKEYKKHAKSDEDTLSKIKFIWHNSREPSNSVVVGKSVPNSLNTSAEFSSLVRYPESWDEQKSQDTLLQSELPNAGPGLVIPKSPWNMEIGLKPDDDDFKSLKQDEPKEDLASRWQLQWEVDQEADEILGGLLPPSPLKSSPPYESPLKNPGAHIDMEEFNFLDYFEGQDQQQPIEDLDNLEPGWDLNEGFEWGPATEELFDEDDDEGREYFVYETKDGKTVKLPVEFLESSLYDQFFGSVDTPIGGSLPDLPGGQMSEFKKGSLSLKLSRRSRGEKFLPPSRRPCSFFLEGNCRRSDCKFSHDLLTITCRFWEEGSCLKGDTCPFRHGYPISRRRNRSEGDQASLVAPVSFASLKEGNPSGGSRGKAIPKKNRGSTPCVSSFELDSEADFPCLGSSVESKIDSFDESSFPCNIKYAKFSKKKKKYITVTKSLLKEAESDCEKGSHSKRGKRSKGNRLTSFDFLSLTANDTADRGGGATSKECESLRKVLRKRHPLPPPPPFSHEDGTLSDF